MISLGLRIHVIVEYVTMKYLQVIIKSHDTR